jgi:hypothetical protein
MVTEIISTLPLTCPNFIDALHESIWKSCKDSQWLWFGWLLFIAIED